MRQHFRKVREILVAAIVAVGVVVSGSTSGAAAAAGLGAGDVFPEFELTRADGSAWRSADYSGQPRVVFFWATWCPYCRKLMPGIVALHDNYADQGLEIVAVNFRDDDGDTVAYASKMGIEFDIVVKGDALAALAGVKGTPTVFVLDRESRIVLRYSSSDPNDPLLLEAVQSVVQL